MSRHAGELVAWRRDIEADVFLPVEFFTAFRRRDGLERERRLMLAVLEDGVACYRQNAFASDAEGRRLFTEARDWIESTDQSDLFAFETICDTLDLDADALRRRLRQSAARRRLRAA